MVQSSTPISGIPVSPADVQNPTLLFRILQQLSTNIVGVQTYVVDLIKGLQLKIPTFQQIKQSLSALGQTPLDVTNLPGTLRDPQPASLLRYNAVPTGLALQSLRDTQFLMVKNGTAYDLYTVLGGNPNSLIKLIAGASGSGYVTLDTPQVIGPSAAKTFNDSVNVNVTQNSPTDLVVTNIFSGTGSAARWNLVSALGTFNGLLHDAARVITRYGITLGGWAELQASAALNGLIIGTQGNTPVVIGTNNIEAGRFDGSQNFTFKKLITSYNGITTAGQGVTVVAATVVATAQTASIATTNMLASAPAGMYRISVYADTTTAGTAGSFTVTLGWNDGTSAETATSASIPLTGLAGDYATMNQVIRSGAAQNITFATTVTGALGSPQYSLYISLERMT